MEAAERFAALLAFGLLSTLPATDAAFRVVAEDVPFFPKSGTSPTSSSSIDEESAIASSDLARALAMG